MKTKLLLKLFALFSSVLFALGGTAESVIGFTEGEPITATKREYCFDRDKLLIGAYYGDTDHIDEASEAGINFFIESSVDEEFLDRCQEYGIGVIAGGYNLPTGYAELPDSIKDKWVNFDYSQYKDHPALWGDDLIDEPTAGAYDNIAASLSAYYENTTGKLALVNLFPSYASEEQLQEFPQKSSKRDFFLATSDNGTGSGLPYKMYVSDYINKIDTDYICVDIYPYYSKQNSLGKEVKHTGKSWIRNLDILAEACRGTQRDLWVITQAAGETKNGAEGDGPRWCDEVTDIRQQAYASLAFGAKAIIHAEFSAKGWWDAEHSHMIDIDGNTTQTYDAVKTVDAELAAFAEKYGKYEYESTYMINPLRVAGTGGGELAVTVPCKAIDIKSPDGLLVGTFKSNRGKAFIVANMNELNLKDSAVFTYTAPNGGMTVYQQGEKSFYAGGTPALIKLEPGEGVFITAPGLK
ncbi:MAG: hypothetical protein MJ177_03195 [Clostridia bacterium]|nr:hypothetical protein [Clostridia bacterium]